MSMGGSESAGETLAVIMPVYNEEAVIGSVIDCWRDMLDELDVSYQLHVYNDGSKDATWNVLQELHAKDAHNLQIHTHDNRGHGPTILCGYKENGSYDWIFQVDSDNELFSSDFPALWAQREHADLVIGWRKDRNSPFVRRLISRTSRLIVQLCYGYALKDVNIPFRLMRTTFFKPWFRKIPDHTFAPNVIVSGIATWWDARIIELPVACQERETGVVSIRRWSLFKAAVRSMCQTCRFRFTVMS